MKKRGKVLRDTSAGPGLLMVEGQQYSFSLEGVWRSEVAPKPGMVVEVELDTGGRIMAISAVAESQLAKEQAEVALAAAKQKGAALASTMVARFGMPALVGAGLLIVGWFFLSTVSINTPLGSLDFTFWQILGFLNAKNAFEMLGQGGRSGPSAGFYGFLALVSIVGPFVHHFWKDRRAMLGGLLPLLFMAGVALAIRSSINNALGPAGTSANMREYAEQAREEAMKMISIGFGAYLSLLASIYFAGVAAKQFLVAKATDNPEQQSRKLAA
ncbi:MAG: hypothetical protein LAO09_09810 [Acidobacteriia bacterium]|nr:hypothetical protein [Terriglobia bacterium]